MNSYDNFYIHDTLKCKPVNQIIKFNMLEREINNEEKIMGNLLEKIEAKGYY